MKNAVALALLLVTACSREAEPANETTMAETRLDPPAPGEPGGLPGDRTQISEGPIGPKTAQGAGQVLQRYFGLLEAGKRAEADSLWSDSGTPFEFANQIAQYREIHAKIGAPGPPEGAAGSVYVEIPVQLYGLTTAGKEFNALATMTLRRVNDVPGSTAAQRQWHIYRIEFSRGQPLRASRRDSCGGSRTGSARMP